ncbi:MAG: hypothetical protein JXA67_16270 [Micromonosporaceae bacterium]|nr:hypothetical protein [Micromonosporaceae bacterium]
MVRRLRLLTALLCTAVVLAPSQTALAAPSRDDSTSTQATTWYDPTTHPVPHETASDPSAVVPMATGGGCTDKYGGAACISYKSATKSLNADFYVTSWDHVDSSGTAYVYIEANDEVNYLYSALTDFVGHYPVKSLAVSGGGSAWTIVDFYNRNGDWLTSVNSPTQYYP